MIQQTASQRRSWTFYGLAWACMMFVGFVLSANAHADAHLMPTKQRIEIVSFLSTRADAMTHARYQWSLISPLAWPSPSTALRVQTHIDQMQTKDPLLSPFQAQEFLSKHTQQRILLAQGKGDGGYEGQQRLAFWHQMLGIGTLVLLAATVVIGTINSVDFFSGRLSSQPMLWTHRILAISTSTFYLGARILAWMIPSSEAKGQEYQNDGSFDSAKWHRLLAWIHGIGMLALIAGGMINTYAIPSYTPAKTAFTVGHLVSGYVTLAALTGAFVVITFF